MSVALRKSEFTMQIIEDKKTIPQRIKTNLLLEDDNSQGILMAGIRFFFFQKCGKKNMDKRTQITMLKMEKTASSLYPCTEDIKNETNTPIVLKEAIPTGLMVFFNPSYPFVFHAVNKWIP